MDIDKICRCCMALSGPLLSIYDGGSAGSGIVAMMSEIAKIKPQPKDNMPEKVCLACISEINRSYVFKIKCENSNRTLRQLLPDAVKETLNELKQPIKKPDMRNISVQTIDESKVSSHTQTLEEEKTICVHREIQTEDSLLDVIRKYKLEEQLHEVEEEESYILEAELDKEFELQSNLEKDDQIKTTTITTTDEEQPQNQQRPKRKRTNEESNSNQQQQQPMKLLKSEDNSYIIFEPSSSTELSSVHEQEFEIETNENEEIPLMPVEDLKAATLSADCEYLNNAEENEKEEEHVFMTLDEEMEYYNNENVSAENLNENSLETKEKKNNSTIPAVSSRHHQRQQQLRKKHYKCSNCDLTFFSIKVLKRHLTIIHKIKNPELVIEEDDQCNLDDNANMNKTNNKTEKNVPTASGQKLDITKLSADNVPNPQLNIKERCISTTKAGPSPEVLQQLKFYCDYCMAGFANLKSLTLHVMKNICMTTNFKCDLCKRFFISEENLNAHKLEHDRGHVCSECNKTCKSLDELSQHMIYEHNRNVRNQCTVCKKVFTMKTALMDHMRIHSGEKPFVCTVCGKGFTQNSNLKQHLMRHTNEKNFVCSQCPNAYVTRAELVSHGRSHTGDHPFKCDECQATFTSRSSLQKHIRKHTGERPYACEICPMRFISLNILKNHRRTHTGERPYKCDLCEKRFSQKGDCLLHQRTHADSQFVCFCGLKYQKRHTLKMHIKNKHTKMTDAEKKKVEYIFEKKYEEVGDVGGGGGGSAAASQADENDLEYQITLMEEEEEEEEEEDEDREILEEENESVNLTKINSGKKILVKS